MIKLLDIHISISSIFPAEWVRKSKFQNSTSSSILQYLCPGQTLVDRS